jgi:hypothetical protein
MTVSGIMTRRDEFDGQVCNRCDAYPGELGVNEKLLRTSNVMGHLALKNNEGVLGSDIDKMLLNRRAIHRQELQSEGRISKTYQK